MTYEERKSMTTNIIQNIILENREKLIITGVLDVLSFDDLVVIVETELGLLTVKGESLHINKLSIDTSEVIVEGNINSLTYSQNNNEIKTDTVEISEGIKITSTATDSIFRANADGIRTENKLGEVTTEFLDNGMKTTDLEADKGIVANLLITEVSGQVWLTGLGR